MREPARDRGRLNDIMEAAGYICAFMDGLSGPEVFVTEAAYMLSPEFKTAHPYIPWNDIIRMRHVLVHGYASILPELLWVTASEEIPVLKRQVEGILSRMDCE